MKIHVRAGLPFVTASLTYLGKQLSFKNTLLDTGSARAMFSMDELLAVGLTYEPDDRVHRIRGVGGTEFVFTKRVDCLTVGDLQVTDFQVEVGVMDYGFDVDGIIGMDFLIQVGAVIDLARLEICRASNS